MRRNKLYTVNKWNQPAFAPDNMFLVGGELRKFYGYSKDAWKGLDAGTKDALKNKYVGTEAYLGHKNMFGISREDNPFSNENIGDTALGIGSGVVSAVSPMVTNFISDGYNANGWGSGISSVGNAVGNAVPGVWGQAIKLGSAVVGGIVNRGFGTKRNEGNINTLNANISAASQAASGLTGVTNSNDFFTAAGQMTTGTGFGTTDLVKGGWWSKGKARRQGQKMLNKENAALAFQNHAMMTGAEGVDQTLDDSIMSNFAAYGGPLSTMPIININTGSNNYNTLGAAIDYGFKNAWLNSKNKQTEDKSSNNVSFTTNGKNSFDEGGLKAAFVEEFGTDPIGAVVRYNQGLDRLVAEQQAAQEAAAREADYLNTQQQLASLQAQNEGLQLALANPAAPTAIGQQDIVRAAENMRTDALAPEPSLPAASEAVVDDYSNLKNFIKAHEGFRSKAYWLPGEAAPTIGYGFYQYYPGTRKKVKMGDTITREEADRGLEEVLKGIDADLSGKVPNWDKLAVHQKDALRDLAYGTGTGGRHFRKNSRLMTALQNEDWDAAEKELVSRSASLPDYDKNLLRISKLRQNMFRSGDYSTKAFGGELGTNGTDFTNGLLEINEGGTHQENPLDGVPVGVDADGIPNLVEEGETIFNDYVFSDRMKVPKFMHKELGLGGGVKKTISFAEASKKLAKESEMRPNDPISQDGLEASLAKLAEIQETERMRKQMREIAGKQYAYGGKKGNMFVGEGDEPNILERDFPRRGVSGEYLGDWGYELSHAPRYMGLLGALGSLFSTQGGEAAIKEAMDRYGWDYQTAAEYVDLATQNTATGIAPIAGRGGVGYRVPRVAQNTRAFQQARQAAQMGQRSTAFRAATSPTTNTARNFVEEANAAANARNLSIGEQWATNTEGALNKAREGLVAGRGTPTDVYKGLEGTMDIRSSRRRLAPLFAGAGVLGTGLAIPLFDDLSRQQNLEAMAPYINNAETPAVEPDVQNALTESSNSGFGKAVGNAFRKYAAAVNPADTPATTPTRGGGSNGTPTPSDKWSPEKETRVLSEIAKATEENNKKLFAPKEETLQGEIKLPDLKEIERSMMNDYYSRQKPKTYPTWMRYAPVFGAGALALTDALGLTNKPDYTYANKIEAAANQAGLAPNVEYTPIGDYLTYNPMDIWQEQNRLNANARATDRYIQNNAAPVGTKIAGLVANEYNNQIGSGNLYRQALEYNDAKRKDVADFNRRTNMFNSQMGLEAAMANARYGQQARQYQLSGLAQAAALRDAIDQRVGAARAANISNFLTSLGNIGRENAAFNMINSTNAARNGYWIDKNGRVHHINTRG